MTRHFLSLCAAVTVTALVLLDADAARAGASRAIELAPRAEVNRVAQYSDGVTASPSQTMIRPSDAVGIAERRFPGSYALGVTLLQSQKLVYAVRLKSGGHIMRVLVNARTGRIESTR